jgi:FKBP-type peptidyl-prolyl cis-trans isomerase
MIDRHRAIATIAAGCAALGLAACGGSKASGIVQAPSGGATSAPVPTTPKPPPQLASKPAVTVPTGPPPATLQTNDLIPGTGAPAATGKSVTVNYVGVLYSNGKEFDSSWKTGKPFAPFTLGQGSVIPGWDKGLVGMKVGGRRELIIPPSLGYGKAGSPPTIPGNATLVFVVDLLAVQ